MIRSAVVAFVLSLMTLVPLFAQQVLEPPSWAPKFELGQPKIESPFGRPHLVIPYKRINSGVGVAKLQARKSQWRVNFFERPVVLDQDAGEIRLTREMQPTLVIEELAADFFVTISANMRGVNLGEFAVSNVVRFGEPTGETRLEQQTERIAKACAAELAATKPPQGLPDGHELLTADSPVALSMPVKVGFYSEWVDGHLIGIADKGPLPVLIKDEYQVRYFDREKWIAATSETLEKAAKQPDSFGRGAWVVLGSTVINSPRSKVLEAGLEVPVGADVTVVGESEHETLIVVEDRGEQLLVGDRKRSSLFDRWVPRSQVIVSDANLMRWEGAGELKEMARNVRLIKERNDRDIGSGIQLVPGDDGVREADLPIASELPENTQSLAPGKSCGTGDLVAYNHRKRWSPALVVSDNGEKLVVRDMKDGFTLRIKREQLISTSN